MLTLHAHKFIHLMRFMQALDGHLDDDAPADDASRSSVEVIKTKLIRRCKQAGLDVSASYVSRYFEAEDGREFKATLKSVANVIMSELDDQVFYAPTKEYLRYFKANALFGKSVFDNFPSAAEDIYEAGTCLALDRPTACVMHLMRALEVCVKVLASSLEISGQNDWGRYIAAIQKELDRRKAAAGTRTPDEQFFAEVALSIDRIRVAWRNPTMHIDNRYTNEHADAILRAVKDFMGHLARRLQEQTNELQLSSGRIAPSNRI